MSSLTFDIETDGLIHELSHVKCLNLIDNETGVEERYTDHEFYEHAHSGERLDTRTPRTGTIQEGLERLAAADEICGHNIVEFDIPAIQVVYPDFAPTGEVFDTTLISRLMYTDIEDRDAIATRKGKFVLTKNAKMRRHSLEAWGIRLGQEQKGDFKPADYGWTWTEYPFSEDCDEYCMQDVRVNVLLVERFKLRLAETGVPAECVLMEHDVARIVSRQSRYGWKYDKAAAEALTAELQKEMISLEEELENTFRPFYKRNGKLATYKRTCKRFVVNDAGAHTRTYKGEEQRGWYSYEEQGAQRTPIKLTDFNPGSRDHIAMRLTALHGWQPSEFTPKGKPKVDESILGELEYPEAKLLAKYFTVDKMLGQVATGDKAQLKMLNEETGRIHGRVTTNGAVTGRMTHSNPNVAQTDKDPRVRALYIVEAGKKLVGCDADSLELRCLAHRLARYDGGEYIKVVLDGNKDDGTDMHTRNQQAVGMNERNNAKTLFYAWAYGAGDLKLGTTMYLDWPEDKQARFNSRFSGEARKKRLIQIGQRARSALVAGINGMETLIKKVKGKVNSPGYLRGLDGRRVVLRSAHAALNTLLQGDGALVMKKALVLLDAKLQEVGHVPGRHYEFVGNIHDEWQIEVDEDRAVEVGTLAAASIQEAGEFFKFRCPLAGDYDVGDNWSQTH